MRENMMAVGPGHRGKISADPAGPVPGRDFIDAWSRRRDVACTVVTNSLIARHRDPGWRLSCL
jgi:hypothetical protein